MKLLKFRNKDLEQQSRHIKYDMNHFSSQIKELKAEEKEKIKMILDMRNEILIILNMDQYLEKKNFH